MVKQKMQRQSVTLYPWQIEWLDEMISRDVFASNSDAFRRLIKYWRLSHEGVKPMPVN